MNNLIENIRHKDEDIIKSSKNNQNIDEAIYGFHEIIHRKSYPGHPGKMLPPPGSFQPFLQLPMPGMPM